MELLTVLKQKVNLLLDHFKQLRTESELLARDNQQLKAESEELRVESAKLIEDNARLMAKIDVLESVALQESTQVESLSAEKKETAKLVDDLIRSIDSLVKCEKQQ